MLVGIRSMEYEDWGDPVNLVLPHDEAPYEPLELPNFFAQFWMYLVGLIRIDWTMILGDVNTGFKCMLSGIYNPTILYRHLSCKAKVCATGFMSRWLPTNLTLWKNDAIWNVQWGGAGFSSRVPSSESVSTINWLFTDVSYFRIWFPRRFVPMRDILIHTYLGPSVGAMYIGIECFKP